MSLFEFIYSSLINNLKGELAELFARPRIRDFADTLQIADMRTILGPRLRERPRTRSRGWLKGADAILGTHEGPSAEIRAVVEIKAMHHPLARIVEQLDGHVDRMRSGGLMIDGIVISPAEIAGALPGRCEHPAHRRGGRVGARGLAVGCLRGRCDQAASGACERLGRRAAVTPRTRLPRPHAD